MSIQDKLASHFEGLVTTSGVVERALERNPKLIKILEDTIAQVKAATRTEDGKVMDATDPKASPIRFMALKRAEDHKRAQEEDA